jgi:transposase-like protein
MKRPNGRCQLCLHSERARAELLLAGRASIKAVARKIGLHSDAVRRHWLQHVTPERRAALAVGPVQQMSLRAQLSEEAESVIDHYRAVRAGLYQLYTSAVEAGDRNGGALVAGRLLTCLDSMARLTGQLATSPLVQNTTNIFLHPAVTRVEAIIVGALADYPDARAAVIRALRAAEASEEPAAPAAIEHEAATS